MKNPRQKVKKHGGTRKIKDAATVEMTPMIDVVFQLLIFFIVTFRHQDILSRLDISRPAPDPDQTTEVRDMIEVIIGQYHTGFSMEGRVMTLQELDRRMRQLAELDPSTPVVIKCTADSRHQSLIEFLDICAKHGLENLSVFSM